MKKFFGSYVFLLVCIISITICSCTTNDGIIYSSENSTSDSFDIPQSYRQIVMDFNKTMEKVLSDAFEADLNSGKFISPNKNFEYEWYAMLIDSTKGIENPTVSSFGYIIKDVNKDKKPELFLMRKDYTILAIFTLNNNVPQMLGAFWSRKKAVMLSNDQLYVSTSGGAQYLDYSIYELNHKNQLSKIKTFGVKEELYYESIDGNITYISKLQFEDLLLLYPFEMSKKWKMIKIHNL